MRAIFVFGGVGAGKTTVAHALADVLNVPLVREPVDENPFLPLYALDRARWALTCQTYYYLQYVREYEKVVADTMAQLTSQSEVAVEPTVIVDAGAPTNRHVYARYMREHALVTVDEYALYETLTQMMDAQYAYPEPSAIVYVSVPLEESLRRLQMRGRDFEVAGHTKDYLDAVSRLTAFMRDTYHRRGVPVYDYDNRDDVDRTERLLSLTEMLRRKSMF